VRWFPGLADGRSSPPTRSGIYSPVAAEARDQVTGSDFARQTEIANAVCEVAHADAVVAAAAAAELQIAGEPRPLGNTRAGQNHYVQVE
jgi:hypothetical protein